MNALALWLALAPPADAQVSAPATSGWVDLAAGLGVAGQPVQTGAAWTLGAGGIFGRYDQAFAVGRGVGVGMRIRQDVLPTEGGTLLNTLVGAESWYVLDLLVLNVQVGGFLGLPIRTTLAPAAPDGFPPSASTLGLVAARAVGSVGYRFRPRLRVFLRLDAGIDVVDVDGVQVQPAVGLMLGLGAILPSTPR